MGEPGLPPESRLGCRGRRGSTRRSQVAEARAERRGQSAGARECGSTHGAGALPARQRWDHRTAGHRDTPQLPHPTRSVAAPAPQASGGRRRQGGRRCRTMPGSQPPSTRQAPGGSHARAPRAAGGPLWGNGARRASARDGGGHGLTQPLSPGGPRACRGGAPSSARGRTAACLAAERAATGLALGGRPGEVIGFSCSSGSSPHLLQASHDRESPFFVDGDT